MNTKRPYAMTTRAAACEEAQRRIMSSTLALNAAKLALEIVLDNVAGRAGMTIPTIRRQFGSRERLRDAAPRCPAPRSCRSQGATVQAQLCKRHAAGATLQAQPRTSNSQQKEMK